MIGYVYELRCPEYGDIMYVGSTRSLDNRIKAHMDSSSGLKVSHWIFNLKKRGLLPVVNLFWSGEATNCDLLKIERDRIMHLFSNGFKLLNNNKFARFYNLNGKSVKIGSDGYSAVKEYCQKSGMKIGKFYDLAAQEKLERERRTEKAQYDENLNRVK